MINRQTLLRQNGVGYPRSKYVVGNFILANYSLTTVTALTVKIDVVIVSFGYSQKGSVLVFLLTIMK